MERAFSRRFLIIFQTEMDAESQIIQVYLGWYSRLHEEHTKHRQLPQRIRNMSEDEGSCSSHMIAHSYAVPIVGYEIVEQRERFTVCIITNIFHIVYRYFVQFVRVCLVTLKYAT